MNYNPFRYHEKNINLMLPGPENRAAAAPLSLFRLPGRVAGRLKRSAAAFILAELVIAAASFQLWRAPGASMGWYALVVALLVIQGVLVYLAVDCIKTCLYAPLERITDWAGKIRQGNLSARITGTTDAELVRPVDDINRAAEWLEALALDKERELENQKSDIERKSRSLELLYDVASAINNATEVEQLTARFMYSLADTVGARAASVRLRDADGTVRQVADLNLDGALLRVEQLAGSRPELFDVGRAPAVENVGELARSVGEPVSDDVAGLELMAVRLQYLDRINGVYLLFIDRSQLDRSAGLGEFLVSIGRQLGLAVEKARLDYEANLLPRMEERAMLANELHDSLAQTLASLRFQVRVLDDTLHQGNESAIWDEMERIETSLEEANIELRELISHFRAPMHRKGLISAISRAVSRFRKETRITTFFQNQWDEIDLPDEWEVHVLRIIQEALANIRKHSQADNVRVLLSREGDVYRVLVEDDGVGFAESEAGETLDDHFGLSIMQERAAIISGEIKVESELNEGTRIILRFPAAAPGKPGAFTAGA